MTLEAKRGHRYKPRWSRIRHQLERLAGPDGWVLWSDLQTAMSGLSTAQIKDTLRGHRGEIEARKYRVDESTWHGRPRFEIRLKPPQDANTAPVSDDLPRRVPKSPTTESRN